MNQSHTDVSRFPARFYSLDVLRGMAALAVVIYHWGSFYFMGKESTDVEHEQLPLYFLFRPIYNEGWRAVDLFFCLSGFVFFWLYADKVTKRVVSAREFFVLRFSRLYPLHFITLLAVAAGQWCMLRYFGGFWAEQINDGYHFVLQLFFASNWGFEDKLSFNGPVWSVSVEVFLYIVFFLLCLIGWSRWWQLLLLVFLGYLMERFYLYQIGRGFISFFLGGFSFQVVTWLLRRNVSRVTITVLALVMTLAWISIPFDLVPGSLDHILQWHPWSRNAIGQEQQIHLQIRLSEYFHTYFLFPLTVITLSLIEAKRGTLGKRMAWLGDISYASYLLHFPLQLYVTLCAYALAFRESFFHSPWTMLTFFIGLIFLSHAVHNLVERPCQSLLRSRLLPHQGKKAA